MGSSLPSAPALTSDWGSDSIPTRGVEQLPATFMDRGVAISFTTPGLSQARIRRNRRDLLELLVPCFADSEGTYVFPWKLVPETITMTLHDRELYDLITRKPGISPWEMRRLQIEVGASGLAGPEAEESCQRALNEENRQRWAANFALIRGVFQFIGQDSEQLAINKFLAPETQASVKRAFRIFAGRIGVPPSECYSAIAEQSVCLAPVGLPYADSPGRLRRILADLRSMILSMNGWASLINRRVGEKARAVVHVSQQTITAAEQDLQKIDVALMDIAAFVRDWREQSSNINSLILRLYWLLDGWDHIATTWFLAIKESEVAAIDAVEEILRILPYLPRMESKSLSVVREDGLMMLGRRRINAMEDWRTRRLYPELVRRLEAVKSVSP